MAQRHRANILPTAIALFANNSQHKRKHTTQQQQAASAPQTSVQDQTGETDAWDDKTLLLYDVPTIG